MYADRYMQAKFYNSGRARVLLDSENEAILDDVYMEAIAKYNETYNSVTEYGGFWSYEEEPIDHTNIIMAEHEDYNIKEVLEIIKVYDDWKIEEEWVYDPFEDCEAV